MTYDTRHLVRSYLQLPRYRQAAIATTMGIDIDTDFNVRLFTSCRGDAARREQLAYLIREAT